MRGARQQLRPDREGDAGHLPDNTEGRGTPAPPSRHSGQRRRETEGDLDRNQTHSPLTRRPSAELMVTSLGHKGHPRTPAQARVLSPNPIETGLTWNSEREYSVR